MLQSLLQPRDSHGPVRHQKRRQEKRGTSGGGGGGRRPSQLALGVRGPDATSPTPSPPAGRRTRRDAMPDYYFCGKVSALHAVVGSLLLGGVLTVVGLVQLSPNAEAAQHRYYLLGGGALLLGLGVALIGFRCYCIHCYGKKVSVGEHDVEAHVPVVAKNGLPPPELPRCCSADQPKKGHDT